MSLTNPNKVITEERLSEFYQTILPYLGGMPDILANKFSKSDLYSTSEKIVGQWIDGKPLYQKTLTDFSHTYNQNTEYSISVGSNIDKIMVQSGYIDIGSGNALLPLNFILTQVSNSIYCFPELINHTATLKLKSVGWSFIGYVITVQYTKTTDSPVSVGNDTDYSTTEKIVGTWIDGKPVYQKTYAVDVDDLSNASITSSMMSGEIRIDSVSYDMIKIKDAFLTDLGSSNTTIRSNPLNYATSDKYIRANLQYDSKYFVYLELTYSVNSFYIDKDNLKFYVTIQYTKTTD